MGCIFGPVPSRRLGFSLGVDIVPYKVCSLDCVYCQLGRTNNKTIERKEYILSDTILADLKEALNKKQRIDYITLSGSGEPTLNSAIGKIITGIKKITNIPIAVLTNGTLLYQKELRDNLYHADLVVPSLDAVSQTVFEKVNRPHPSIIVEKMIDGLRLFREMFCGQIWLEIVFVKGLNDDQEEIEKMKSVIEKINADKIQLNTVVRPPAEKFAKALSLEELERIRDVFGERCEIVGQFEGKAEEACNQDIEEEIIEVLKRRPVTILDISNILGLHINEVVKYINHLKEKKIITIDTYDDQNYYHI